MSESMVSTVNPGAGNPLINLNRLEFVRRNYPYLQGWRAMIPFGLANLALGATKLIGGKPLWHFINVWYFPLFLVVFIAGRHLGRRYYQRRFGEARPAVQYKDVALIIPCFFAYALLVGVLRRVGINLGFYHWIALGAGVGLLLPSIFLDWRPRRTREAPSPTAIFARRLSLWGAALLFASALALLPEPHKLQALCSIMLFSGGMTLTLFGLLPAFPWRYYTLFGLL